MRNVRVVPMKIEYDGPERHHEEARAEDDAVLKSGGTAFSMGG